MKKYIWVVALLFSIVMLLSSCSSGISQEQYDKVSSDLTNAQTQIQTLQTQISSLQRDLQAANDKINRAKILADIVDSMMKIYSNASAMTEAQLAETYVQWSNGIKAIGDPLLSTRFDALISAQTESQQNQASEDFMLYLFELQSKLLQ